MLEEYAEAIDEHGAERRYAVMTSAVRDAANGDEFAAAVRDRYGLDGRTLSGDEEARLTFLGATAAREGDDGPLLVIDIGGGSTELVVGEGGEVALPRVHPGRRRAPQRAPSPLRPAHARRRWTPSRATRAR